MGPDVLYNLQVSLDGRDNRSQTQGFEPVNVAGRAHSNGGGFVANSANVASTAYVGPFARVLGGTVQGNARIEGGPS
jgi:hypothetical protein